MRYILLFTCIPVFPVDFPKLQEYDIYQGGNRNIMKLKKIISLLLATVIVMSVFAVSTIALADESDDFEYTVLDDGTAEITKYIGSNLLGGVTLLESAMWGFRLVSRIFRLFKRFR